MTDGDFALLCFFGLPVLGSILGSIYFGSEGKPFEISARLDNEDEEYINDPACPWPNITPYVSRNTNVSINEGNIRDD